MPGEENKIWLLLLALLLIGVGVVCFIPVFNERVKQNWIARRYKFVSREDAEAGMLLHLILCGLFLIIFGFVVLVIAVRQFFI